MRLGKVVKSNSHCDYVIQVDDEMDVSEPPQPDEYGFASFVKLETIQRHWAVGLVYNSQLFNPAFLNTGPRLVSEPEPFFTPDLIKETHILLWTVLIGTFQVSDQQNYGSQGVPTIVVPVNTPVWRMSEAEVRAFHQDQVGKTQFAYYSHVLKSGGLFASQLMEQVLEQVGELFEGSDRRVLEILRKELLWKHTLGMMR